ncbi:MAG: hypothetical protein IJU29_08500 [Oscillospiraceae bacterium]|nr:hypothetical protein [Oscillospiraceae bacterium]
MVCTKHGQAPPSGGLPGRLLWSSGRRGPRFHLDADRWFPSETAETRRRERMLAARYAALARGRAGPEPWPEE